MSEVEPTGGLRVVVARGRLTAAVLRVLLGPLEPQPLGGPYYGSEQQPKDEKELRDACRELLDAEEAWEQEWSELQNQLHPD